MPAIMKITLNTVHRNVLEVGTLPTSGSEGQLLVYEVVLPGRSVTLAQAVQKKNADICRRCSAVSIVPFFMA